MQTNTYPRAALLPAQTIGRHRHGRAYGAMVVAGGYREAGDRGRRWLTAGQIAFHRPFDAHTNLATTAGAEIFNFDLPDDVQLPAFAQIGDVDHALRSVRAEASLDTQILLDSLAPIPTQREDWPDDLLADILRDPGLHLASWAEDRRIRPEDLADGFFRCFGVSPKRFRMEAKVRAALDLLRGDEASLAVVALDSGFCDQAHMSRAVKAVTGSRPLALRRSPSKTVRLSRGATSSKGSA